MPDPRRGFPAFALGVLGLGLLATAGCGSPEEPTALSDRFAFTENALPASEVDTIVATGSSGLGEPLRAVISSDEEWEALWATIHRPVMPAPPLPALDLSQRVLVVAAMGARRSGGYSIEVPAVARDGSDLVVGVLERSPGPACIVTAALTAPVVVVSVPAPAGQVRFIEEAVTYDC